MAAIIQTVNLRKAYKVGNEKVVALDCINLEIEKGQVCCILGTSGSGKSTLLNQLAGLEKPTRGEVYIKGKKISAMSEKQLAHFRQRNVGFVFQSYNLLSGMSAVENVAIPLTFRGMAKKKRLRLAKEMLTIVGLGKRLNHLPTEMSGGQQQRVGIARAFVARPDVVFADEPTGNLDTHTTREIMNLFLSFAREKGITIVLVSHDRELARYADRIVTIVDGQIIDDSPNRSLYDVAQELTHQLITLGEAGSWEEMAEQLAGWMKSYGEGVAAQTLETFAHSEELFTRFCQQLPHALPHSQLDEEWRAKVQTLADSTAQYMEEKKPKPKAPKAAVQAKVKKKLFGFGKKAKAAPVTEATPETPPPALPPPPPEQPEIELVDATAAQPPEIETTPAVDAVEEKKDE